MKQLDDIKALIRQGAADEAIRLLDEFLHEHRTHDEAWYLRGNAYRKLGNWQQAMNSYQEAIDLNPDSPARPARQMVVDILEFYNKDMYNQ